MNQAEQYLNRLFSRIVTQFQAYRDRLFDTLLVVERTIDRVTKSSEATPNPEVVQCFALSMTELNNMLTNSPLSKAKLVLRQLQNRIFSALEAEQKAEKEQAERAKQQQPKPKIKLKLPSLTPKVEQIIPLVSDEEQSRNEPDNHYTQEALALNAT